MGTTNGELVLARSSCFYSEPEQTTSVWGLGRCYYAHAGEISSLHVVNNDVYTSGSSSNAVMKWTIVEEMAFQGNTPEESQGY